MDDEQASNEGVRFSQNYLNRGQPTRDSARMRRRLFRLFRSDDFQGYVEADDIEAETGTKVPWGGYGHDWDKFFRVCELRDLLDLVTLAAKGMRQDTTIRGAWVHSVERIFREENVGYRVDPLGGVHFAVDGEFEANQASAIAALKGARYGAARSHVEAAHNALDAVPPRTREAVRQTFEAVETVFKLMHPDVARLGSAEAQKKLRPLIEAASVGTERDCLLRLLDAFREWINAAHQYRHGQGVEQPDDPSLETAILSVSVGAGFLRWLAGLDAAQVDKAAG